MSTYPAHRFHTPRLRGERGMALVIALIFLLMLTLLGVASLSTNTAEERMTYAAADYSRAFQSADSAISQGEYWLQHQPSAPAPCDTDSTGCILYPAGSTVVTDTNLKSSSWWSTNGLNFADTYTVGNNSNGTARPTTDINLGRLSANVTNYPSYLMQYIGPDNICSKKMSPPPPPCPLYYRVTGNGAGVQPQMRALTQSIYALNLPPPP